MPLRRIVMVYTLISAGKLLTDELNKINEHMEKKQEEGINESDLKIYEIVEKAIEKRINQLDEKYKYLNN